MGLNAQRERDLGVVLEDPNQWGTLVELIGPDGKEYKTSANSPDPLNPLPLYGQVLRNSISLNPDTQERLIVAEPVVVLRLSSLERVPKAHEKWHIRFATESGEAAEMEDYSLSETRAPEISTLEFIRLYPLKTVQS